MKTVIALDHIHKTYQSRGDVKSLEVLKDIQLEIRENEFVCLVGPSGCGKSTLLRIMAGLEPATSGSVFYRDQPYQKPGRNIGMVFQNYSLMPWLNVEDNIGLGLAFQRTDKARKKAIVEEYLEMVGLNKFRASYPHELSGGMQQRVAIARSLANDPDVLLMDEPFGALDAYTRIQLQKELLNLWETHRKTIVFVTHSVDEAIYLADRIILMSRRQGFIERDLTVDIPRPRNRSLPEFARLNQQLLSDLERFNEHLEPEGSEIERGAQL